MSIDAKILNETLPTKSNNTLKRSYTTTKWDLFQVHKNGSTHANQSMSYTTLTKEKSKHKIFSIDTEKAMDKIQHPFMVKTLTKVGIEGTYLNIIKADYDKPS